ncbi:hypothetical protein AWZ03_008972 [Drosophila navojoa]|uniref:Uncharacterized protein n=1 Tax=Drosophila navojoa TaxID=7232 RepID=A0A484B6W3_DRONA|nr:hypothetical protein AWZ03_008972 [Drosophila navojoa]
MSYLTPTAQSSSNSSSSSNAAQRLTSRSASPNRRGRANSLTPSQDAADLSPLASPQPLHKRPPRPTQLNEIFRPRCNTDPSNSRNSSHSSSNSKKPTATRSVLGSLLRQTLKVTTASVGFSASEERSAH